MSKNRELKEVKVSEIHEKLAKAKSAVLVDYRGLTVADVTDLRNKFRAAGVDYRVYKNRLVKLASKDTAFESLSNDLEGPNAIAIGYEDPTVPAKIAKDFAKKNNKLEVRSGVVDGTYYDAQGIIAIADIPSREVLIAKFMGPIQSPVSKFVRTLQAIADKPTEA